MSVFMSIVEFAHFICQTFTNMKFRFILTSSYKSITIQQIAPSQNTSLWKLCWIQKLYNFLINVTSRYDGQRAQIHRLLDGSVRIFSRQMKESTSRFPDLVNIIKDLCRPELSSFILDAEVSFIHKESPSFYSWHHTSLPLVYFCYICANQGGGNW